MDPGVFEVDEIIVEAYSDNVMSVLEVVFIRGGIVFVFPSLDEDDYRSASREQSRQIINSHILSDFCSKTHFINSPMQFFRLCPHFLISQCLFCNSHFPNIFFPIIAEYCCGTGRPTGIVCSLINIRNIEYGNSP